MSKQRISRLYSDVDLDDATIEVREPFRVFRDEQRQYVRLEIATPMTLIRIRDAFGSYWPDGENQGLSGTVLNISGGGVLIELNEPLSEGDLVTLGFTLQATERLDGVLAVVKRCDQEEDGCLVGLEFVDRGFLSDTLTHAQLELLSEHYDHFSKKVHDVLQKYISRKRVSSK